MRPHSQRVRELIEDGNVTWRTDVEWSNDGETWNPCEYRPGGKVTRDSTRQVHWDCALSVAGIQLERDGIRPFGTQIRINHGIDNEQMWTFGRYVVQDAARDNSDPDVINLVGWSLESAVIAARFLTVRSFNPQDGRTLLQSLVREVIPSAQFVWNVDQAVLTTKIIERRDRWKLIDGGPDDPSIVKAMGARVLTGPSGEWRVEDIPSLTDPVVWEATEGTDTIPGPLLTHGEKLTRAGVYNVVVVDGEATDGDTLPFDPGIAMDLDPLSLTYALTPVDQGGFGQVPRYYTNPLIKNTVSAQRAARSLLAPYLGLRQQIDFTQLHDPTREPGDVGIVWTDWGPRRAIPDAITYSLDGDPLATTTRTTATRLDGSAVEADDGGGE